MRILGIDPGLQTTGFGVIDVQGQKLRYVASGCIKSDSTQGLPLRLHTLFAGITEIIGTYQPNVSAVEQVFSNVNPQSTLLLGQARGAAIPLAAGAQQRPQRLPPNPNGSRRTARRPRRRRGRRRGLRVVVIAVAQQGLDLEGGPARIGGVDGERVVDDVLEHAEGPDPHCRLTSPSCRDRP